MSLIATHCGSCGHPLATDGKCSQLCEMLKLVPPADPAPTHGVALQGWECPRCRVIHSPFVHACGCAPPFGYSIHGGSF